MTAAARSLYGKCFGNGRWHLVAVGGGPARCGVRPRYQERRLPIDVGRREICPKCRTAERRAAEQAEGSDR